jgi:signal transduction histidine kinase
MFGQIATRSNKCCSSCSTTRACTRPPARTSTWLTQSDASQVTLTIRDTGPGIAPEVLPHLFERFYRGDFSRSGSGAGLGLAIAKELIQAQGGTITAQSTLGQGSAFIITLPRAPQSNSAA